MCSGLAQSDFDGRHIPLFIISLNSFFAISNLSGGSLRGFAVDGGPFVCMWCVTVCLTFLMSGDRCKMSGNLASSSWNFVFMDNTLIAVHFPVTADPTAATDVLGYFSLLFLMSTSSP